MKIFKILFNNTRKPKGLLGKWMVNSMNHAHAAVADWGMSHLPDISPGEIADLGCGGGRNVKELLQRYPAATVTALDYAELSVRKTQKVNQPAIQKGRCHVIQGDVSHLPFEDHRFHLVTAFETVYFWPGPAKSFREVCRVLKPGGTFLIVNESDGMNPCDGKWLNTIEGLRIFTDTQLTGFLTEAGFSKITVNCFPKKHWLCILATR